MTTQQEFALKQIIKQGERLVHWNLSNDAYMQTAVHFKQDKLVEEFESIASEQCYLGYMSQELLFKRNALKEKLLSNIQAMESLQTMRVFKSLL